MVSVLAIAGAAAPMEQGQKQVQDIFPEIDHDSQQSAKMQKNLERQVSGFLYLEKVLGQGKMSGTADRQEFRESLQNAKKDRCEESHKTSKDGRSLKLARTG
jgi:hypothetical protein